MTQAKHKINVNDGRCHRCAHMEPVPGNTHISCTSPDPRVRGDAHGIRNGWFIYPLLFDPIWMTVPCTHFLESPAYAKSLENTTQGDDNERAE